MTTEEKAVKQAELHFKMLCNYTSPEELIKRAYRAGYLAGATETLASQWVSVEDRLPKRGEDVLIYTKKGQIKMSCWEGAKDIDDNESRHRHWKWWGNLRPYVLCWMPLPIPPLKGGDA